MITVRVALLTYYSIAHGENELKERPKKPEEEVKETRINRRSNEDTNLDTHDHIDQRTSWRSGNQQHHQTDTHNSRSRQVYIII